MENVLDRLEARLRAAGIAFDLQRHAPVFTSEEAAAIRGAPLGSGAKAIVMKVGEAFALLVVPADRKVDSRKVRAALGVKSLRFASKEELAQLTGLTPGAVPPFGSLFNLQTWCDPDLAEHGSINFNAGDHAVSIRMTFADYCSVEQPTLARLTEPTSGS